MKAVKSSRKGLSPLLAIIIGLIVTIVAGILLAQLYFSYAATISARPAANVEYADAIASSSGGGALVVNIKNIGNIPITSIVIDDAPGSNKVIEGTGSCKATDINVPSGATHSMTCSLTGVSIGSIVNATVTVSFSDGSTQVYAVTARVRSA